MERPQPEEPGACLPATSSGGSLRAKGLQSCCLRPWVQVSLLLSQKP